MFTYKKFKENNFNIEYESKKFILLPSFYYNDKKIRAMTYKPDFIINDKIIIECKGYCTDAWPLRMKLFEYVLLSQNLPYNFYVVHTQEEVESLIAKLKEKL